MQKRSTVKQLNKFTQLELNQRAQISVHKLFKNNILHLIFLILILCN